MKTIKGDLIKLAQQGEFDVIVHGCNCFNTFGKGIALSVKKAFPAANDADQATVKGDINKLGTYTQVTVELKSGARLSIVNAYTQYNYWDKRDLFEYEAFQNFLDDMVVIEKTYSWWRPLRWGFPLIGCGLAGGDKERILKMIETTLAGMDVTIVEFDGGN